MTYPRLRNIDLIAGIRLLIPCSNKGGEQYNELKLCKDPVTMDTQGGTDHYLYYKTGSNNVYVYFYGQDDPRPLLVCYNSNAYKPSSTSGYDTKWVNASSIKKCGCDRGRGGGKNDQLLPVLTQVVGVLNTVQLHTHPKECNGAESGEGVSPTTTQCTNGNTCTYEVHTYTGRGIKVKVTCETVNGQPNGEPGAQGNGGSNGVSQSNTCTYKTITHEPIGMNDGGAETSNGAGFRLGDVTYTGTDTSGKVNYYTGLTATKHKYNPLVRVTGYYLQDDEQFEKPLVVVLEFQTSSLQPPPPTTTSKEYYKLTKTGEEMEWSSDSEVERKISSGVCALFSYLQTIKFILNKKIYVLIDRQGQYKESDVQGITDSRKKRIEVSIYQPETISVGPGEELTGPEPAESPIPYKKYTHDITVDLGSNQLRDFPDDARRDVTLELVPSIPNVMIPMFEGGVGGKKAKLTFSNGQGEGSSLSTELKTKLVVYFYNHPSGDSPPEGTDKVPLMLEHNKTFYGPKDRDTYFERWEAITILSTRIESTSIKNELDRVNKALNEVKIEETTNGDGSSNGKTIEVSECNSQCSPLTSRHYKCYQHKITSLGDKLNQVGGIALTLPGKPPTNVVEIKLFNDGKDGKCNNGSPDTQVTPLTYNRCMGDMYVFFYHGGTTDTVPLMLWYNKQYYKPKTRDDYFSKWVCVKGIVGGPPCGSDVSRLAGELDKVNRALNVIELDKSRESKYGLPDKQAGPLFSTDRVTVKTQQPTSKYANTTYTRIVHRTKNGFTIGEIKYGGQEITRYGVNAGLGANIKIKNNGHNNHKSKVEGSGWNTVVCYYSQTDATKKLPQLIVVLKTDNPIDGQDVKGSAGISYGYYILTNKTDGGSSDYEYVWRTDTGGVTLDDQTDFNLLNSVVILLEKQNGGYNGSEIQRAISTAIKQGTIKSPGQLSDVNRIQGSGKKVKVEDTTLSAPECSKYGYKVYQHDFEAVVKKEGQIKQPELTNIDLILGVRILIPTGNNGDTGKDGQTQYRQLTLSESGTSDTTSSGPHYLYFTGSHKQLYVYFYSGLDSDDDSGNGGTTDQRPLLMCYNNRAYRPNATGDYDTKWVNAPTIQNCDCTSGRGGNTQLLEALTQVVGFLNKVELQRRPGGGGVCNGASGVPTTCTNGDTPSSCTYEVHNYQGKPIKVKVTCSKVEGSKGPTYTQGCYYMSMTHTPNGMNGDGGGVATNGAQNGAKGFRLGQVQYKGTASGKVNYTISGSYKWYPLLKVTTYYYSEDKNYEKPLLVVLDFKKSGSKPPGPNEKEYYKLTSGDSMSLEWSIDKGAVARLKGTDGSQVDNTKLIDYLNSIRFENMKVVQIQIQKNTVESYPMKVKSGTGGGRFSPLPGDGVGSSSPKQIQVQECTGCTKLGDGLYKCFVHKLTDAVESGHLENTVGGIKLTIPGNPGQGDVEIPLFKKGGGGGSNGATDYEPIKPLTYNKCMGDIYVYFYKDSGKGDRQPDSVPLMLVYNNKFYRPENRDQYFKKWIPVEELKFGGESNACGKEPNGAQKLTAQLDEVNRELNRIELDKPSPRGQNYGLPDRGGAGATVNKVAFPTERVTVVEKVPTDSTAKLTYTRIVHRTKNGFTVGKLTSNKGKDITSEGLLINGVSIKAGGGSGGRTNGNHTSFTNKNKLNTVVAYYSIGDARRRLPQLMVLLHTSEPVGSGGDTPITGSATEKKYGYYIITDERGENYQYVWRPVNDAPQKGVTLDDKTDFKLLNSVVILLERKGTSAPSKTYGESEISAAVRTAINNKSVTASPGNKDDVNRLTGKTIQVKDESEGATTLTTTGFKCWTHDISALVELSGKLKSALSSVKLIGGLRFLIPTKERNSYRQLTLKDNGEPSSASGGLILYHKPSNNNVCVFFYQGEDSTGGGEGQGDPRPLLMCYANQGYAPKDLKCYFEEWHKDSTVKDCKCEKSTGGGDGDKILQALVKVSNFLNPVKIHIKRFNPHCKSYKIHKFNGERIEIKVEEKKSENSFCYHKYTHKHNGTCNGGTGFRLGNIMYNNKCIKLNGGTSNDQCITASHGPPKYKPSPEVVTYYYKGDKKYKNPLLVVLKQANGGDGGKYQPYYELQKPGDKGAGDKKYKKKDEEIKLDDTSSTGQLAQKLDAILFNISQRLQVILDQRPMAKLLCPPKKDPKNKDEPKPHFECEEPGKNGPKSPAKHPPASNGVIPPFYDAQLYPPNGRELKTELKTTHVVVEEVRKCKELALRGYRCYKHKLTEVVGIEEVGGLKLHLYGDKELELHKEIENEFPEFDPCVETEKVEPVTYNTCKGNIYVYFYGDDPRPLMLCYDGKGYNDAKLEKVEVYYNQYENKTPLLFVLQFQGVSGLNKYYKRSEFESKMSGKQTVSISEMTGFYSDTGILTTLINENDKLPDFLTFNIIEKGDDSVNTYNGYKINVQPVF